MEGLRHTIVGFVLLGTALGARADCGLTGGAKAGSIRMPMIAGAGNGPEEDRERHGSIVGLWHTIYTSVVPLSPNPSRCGTVTAQSSKM